MSDLSIDQLNDQAIEGEQVKKAQEEMLLPVGTYRTTPPPVISAQRFDAKEAEGDKPAMPARTVIRFFSAVAATLPVKNEETGEEEMREFKGRIAWSISPDLQKQANRKTGALEYDRMSKNYVALANAYKAAYNQAPKTVGDLVGYVKEFPVNLRIIKIGVGDDATGEPGNMVVNISPVRE